MELTETQLDKLRVENARVERRWLDRLVRRLRWRFLSQDFCPVCAKYTRWGTETDNPIHPDGPPLFVRQWCKTCGLDTGVHPSILLEHAIEHYERFHGKPPKQPSNQPWG
jgi:hypothetical protein